MNWTIGSFYSNYHYWTCSANSRCSRVALVVGEKKRCCRKSTLASTQAAFCVRLAGEENRTWSKSVQQAFKVYWIWPVLRLVSKNPTQIIGIKLTKSKSVESVHGLPWKWNQRRLMIWVRYVIWSDFISRTCWVIRQNYIRLWNSFETCFLTIDAKTVGRICFSS